MSVEENKAHVRRFVPVVARFSGLLLIFAGSYILYFWFIDGGLLS